MEAFFKIGIITSPHGVKGEVKVFPTTDDAKRFTELKNVISDNGKERRTLHVESVKFSKNMVIVKFQECNDMDEAAKLKQTALFVERKDAVRLNKDEYFVADLIGCHVVDEQGKAVGVLREVLPTGANDVYEVVLTEDSAYGSAGTELLLPAIKSCIKEVDVEEMRMVVHVPEGLLDE